jgi:hypothetical protein
MMGFPQVNGVWGQYRGECDGEVKGCEDCPSRRGFVAPRDEGEQKFLYADKIAVVMAGLDPAIHVFAVRKVKAWLRGSSPGMTILVDVRASSHWTPARGRGDSIAFGGL